MRWPAADFLGPLVLSAAVHLAGLTESAPPAPLVNAAQVALAPFWAAAFSGSRCGSCGGRAG